MATYSAILVPDGSAGNSSTVSGTSASAAINVGKRRIFAINATGDVSIRFGGSSIAAVATDFRIPANQTFVFDSGDENAYFSLYNAGASSVTYYWAYLSKF